MIIRALGDTAFLIRDENRIDPVINARIRGLYLSFLRAEIPGIVDLVPAYCDLKVQYDPTIISYKLLFQQIQELIKQAGSIHFEKGKLHRIPVVYGGAFGPDIQQVMKTNFCSEKRLIQLHTKPEYLVYMIGFTPGFPYLGGLDSRISCARKPTPEMKIPIGSVGIADNQTGIYPVESPGGWQIIGRTPVALFNPALESPFLINPGDSVAFYEISPEEYNTLADA